MTNNSYAFRAEFFDVDSMGVMWHGNYVKYCEMARCRLLDSIGYNYLAMKQSGFALPVVKMDFKYIAPILFNDDFVVQIAIDSFDSFFALTYTFLKDSNKLCIAHTKQVAVYIDENKTETCFILPQDFRDKITAFLGD